MPPQALDDVLVLDLTHYIAGPYCTKLLADYGARVIKIERPDGGDPCRRLGPFPDDVPHPEKSGLFLHLNTNKESVTLNLKLLRGRQLFMRLVAKADVVVENFHPRVMPALGLDYPDLRPVNTRLLMTSVSNFGQTGPYRDWRAQDLTLYGMGGEMYTSGTTGREPLKQAHNLTLYQGGAVAATATMVGLMGVRRHGVGQHIDVSLFETQAGSIDRRMTSLVAYQYTGDNPGTGDARPVGILPAGIFRCQDGYVDIRCTMNWWPRLVAMLEMPELNDDPRFGTEEARFNPANRAPFLQIFHDLAAASHAAGDRAQSTKGTFAGDGREHASAGSRGSSLCRTRCLCRGDAPGGRHLAAPRCAVPPQSHALADTPASATPGAGHGAGVT